MLTFPVVYSCTGKQHRIRQNNDIDITSEMALVLNLYSGNEHFVMKKLPEHLKSCQHKVWQVINLINLII